ncbi:MAG: hypothetical protein ACYDHO_03910 [Gaiellaceae bacterium]
MKRRNRGRRFLGTILLTLLFAVSAYAFTATNVVPPSQAGDGNAAISGYTVSNVAYQLAADPANIASWSFDLSAAAGTVQSKLVSTSSAYTSCVNGGGNHWVCTPAALQTVSAANDLRVVATS